MTKKNFEALASETLESLSTQFEERFGDTAEIDLEDGVLRVEFDDLGVYLINRHSPLSQIWLSSPKSGAWHFAKAEFSDRKATDWVSTRGDKLYLSEILNRELAPTIAFNTELQ